jgi:methylase of polypeptide subunit release factors
MPSPAAPARLHWTENGAAHDALWHSESGWAPPTRVQVVDDTLTADAAYKLVKAGTGLLWRGDFQNARQLQSALVRRIDHSRRAPELTLRVAFERHRTEALTRSRLLGLLLVQLDADSALPLRRAPDVRAAAIATYGSATESSVTSLRELLGAIGAQEWRSAGVEIPTLNARIHPHYGVFSPVRGEYLDLVNTAPLPADSPPVAFDIGTGTGVIAAILARRGVARVVATELAPRALACARDNVLRLGLVDQIDVIEADLFPAGRANLIVCNPPWIPAAAVTATDHAVYDPDSRMLHGFLTGLAEHLEANGEGWLIISNIAELLGLRSRGELLDWIDDAGLEVIARMDTRPVHRRAADTSDPLHAARSHEITSLWRLRAAPIT